MANNENTMNDDIIMSLAERALSELFGMPVCLVDENEISPNKKINSNKRTNEKVTNKTNKKVNMPKSCREYHDNKMTHTNTIHKSAHIPRDVRAIRNIETCPIREVKYNDPATIVFWKDNTKTVVKAESGVSYDPQAGLALAICKKVLGNQEFHDIFEYFLPDDYPGKTDNKPNDTIDK